MAWFKEFFKDTKSFGALFVTFCAFVAFFWVLYYLLHNIGDIPKLDKNGAVERDQWERSKDAMLFVTPITTAAFGWVFGSDGKVKAEEKAEQAQTKTDEAQARARQLGDQKAAILGQAGPEVLEAARNADRKAFGLE